MKFLYSTFLYFLLIFLETIPLSIERTKSSLKIPNVRKVKFSCSESEFACLDSKTCLNITQVCDLRSHCADRSDETLPACYWKYSRDNICHEFEFKCHNHSKCIAHKDVCNGIVDCVDGSDESVCITNSTSCEKICALSTKCIEKKHVCDGIVDCPEMDDELLCNNTCLTGQYKCGISNQCVDSVYVCDGFVDCGNMADEKECHKHTDFSDSFKNFEQPCLKGETVCECPIGFQSVNNSHCEDVDECKTNTSFCSQRCQNMAGSFICKCFRNFKAISKDSKSCVPIAATEFIFYTTQYEIQYLNVENNDIGSFNFSNISLDDHHYFFAFDLYIDEWPRGISLIWSDIHSGSILSSKFASLTEFTNSVEVIYSQSGSQIYQIVIDDHSKTIYWYDEAEITLNAMNLATRARTILLDHKTFSSIISLAFHQQQSKLFWIDVNNYYGKIVSGSSNGRHHVTYAINRMLPSALAIDESDDRIYWVEKGSRLMTISTKTQFAEINMITKLPMGDPFSAVIINNNYVYSEMSRKGEVYAINIIQPHQNSIDLTYGAITLKRVNQVKLGIQRDPCHRSKCNQLCLPDHYANNYTCHCSPEFQLSQNQFQCILKKNLSIQQNFPLATARNIIVQIGSHYWKYMTIITMVVCVTGLMLLGMCYYKCGMTHTNTYEVLPVNDQFENVAETEFYDSLLIDSWDHDGSVLLNDSYSDI